jgi:hypothetical protein
VSYVALSAPTVAINIFSTVTLPPTTSQLSWGFTDIERGRDGQLYLATSPTAPAELSLSPGPLYVLNMDSNTLKPLKIGGTTQVYSRTYADHDGFGYRIQNQIDGESFSSYSLSPDFNVNGVTQSSLAVIPQVVLCDGASLLLQFNTGGYMTSGGITLQKGNVSGSTFTPVGLPIGTTGNPLGAPTLSGTVDVGSIFGLGSYTGGIRLTLSFSNACTTVTVIQTFNIQRAGLAVDFKLFAAQGCSLAQNRITNIASLASSSPYTQPWSGPTAFCKDGWQGDFSTGIKQSTFTPSGILSILDYYLLVQQVDNTGAPIGSPIISSTQPLPYNDFQFNPASSFWFITNYNTIKNSAYFKVTLGAHTTPCGTIERNAYFRIIDGGSNHYKQVQPGSQDGDAVQVFPNPASGKVQLNWYAGNAPETDARIRLNDVFGKTVLQQSLPQQQGSNEGSIDISRLAPGVYYYQMETGGAIHNGKITRQ